VADRRTGRPLDIYLTVGDDGYGVITMLRPEIAPIRLTQRRGVYAQPGEPILLRHLCPELVRLALGELPPPNEPWRCRLTVEVLDRE